MVGQLSTLFHLKGSPTPALAHARRIRAIDFQSNETQSTQRWWWRRQRVGGGGVPTLNYLQSVTNNNGRRRRSGLREDSSHQGALTFHTLHRYHKRRSDSPWWWRPALVMGPRDFVYVSTITFNLSIESLLNNSASAKWGRATGSCARAGY